MPDSVISGWRCPFCNQYASAARTFPIGGRLSQPSALGTLVLGGNFILCPNPGCKRATIGVALYRGVIDNNGNLIPSGQPINSWSLLPESEAKPFPDYVPEAVRNDYTEACLIKQLSPKASATLARRALQGMIRDFWAITTKHTLKEEIEGIKEKVDPDTWKAIDGVRRIGNIGAHMEKDIDVIIDVEPEEADKLIWLIETLIDDWYIAREERRRRLEELHSIAASKENPEKSK